MNKNFINFLQVLFIALDLIMLNLAYFIAQTIFAEDLVSEHFLSYAQFRLIINGFWLILSLLRQVYAFKNISYFDHFLRTTFRGYTLFALLVLMYLFLPRLIPLSRRMVFTTVSLFFLGLVINRVVYFSIREWVKVKVDRSRKILILGYNSTAKKFANYLEKEGLGFQIMGYIDDKKDDTKEQKYPVYNGITDALATAKRLRVNEVFSTIMPENNSRVYNLMQQADKDLIRFRLVADFSKLVDRPVHVDLLHDLPLLSLRCEPLENVLSRFAKRTFDIAVSGYVTIFILSWLIPILGILMKLESRGPVLFVQLRSGKNNKPFRCYKFRSMGANNATEATQATKNDKRVTRIGRILRKTSLDEFPQFLNVLQGHMSIVGPRPHMLKHTKSFSTLADDYMIRQFLKPGITGWAQVNGYRGEITELLHIKKRVEYDLWYLENWTFWLDIRIMFLTVYNVFKGEKNAY